MKTKYHSTSRSPIGRAFQGLAIALVVALAAGCASVNRLREAQDSFNQAAATENALRFDTKPADAVGGLASVRSGYASALLSISKLEDSKDRTQLQKDKLWGTALTLKALTQWRLGQYDAAIKTAELARQTEGDQIYPRDLALITALPGLVKTDQAYGKALRPNVPLAEVEELLIGSNGAVANIQSARVLVDKDHPVQVYLIEAQLAAYRNFQVAYDNSKQHRETVPATHPARTKANEQLNELRRLFKLEQGGQAGQDIINYWIALCILD